MRLLPKLSSFEDWQEKSEPVFDYWEDGLYLCPACIGDGFTICKDEKEYLACKVCGTSGLFEKHELSTISDKHMKQYVFTKEEYHRQCNIELKLWAEHQGFDFEKLLEDNEIPFMKETNREILC